MADPLLMVLLHGGGEIQTIKDPEYEIALEGLSEEYVKDEIEKYVVTSKLLTREQAKNHLKRKFKEAVKMDEQQNLLKQAVRCILQDGKMYLNEEDWALLEKEMDQVSEKMANFNYKEEAPEILFPFLGMTQKGLDAIDRISRKKYEEENFAIAMALNVLLTTFNTPEFIYWFHLGISCQDCGFFDKAIKAYSICQLIDFAHIASWLFCAECYLNMQNKQEAKIKLDEGLKIAETLDDTSKWNDQINYLKRCLASYKS
jgi:tetratricopeptide (TPR) repeat protein